MHNILIVDDTADYAENLKYMLIQSGFNAVFAMGGKQGLEMALSIKPDLILMDIMMPEQDGIETTIRIREQKSLKKVPVVFLTSVTAGDNVVTSVDGKDFPTISKMINFDKLLKKIREHLKITSK